VRCEIAKLFGVLPASLKRLPLSEFQIMYQYWMRSISRLTDDDAITSEEPKDGIVLE
jgi:hypothetical protein